MTQSDDRAWVTSIPRIIVVVKSAYAVIDVSNGLMLKGLLLSGGDSERRTWLGNNLKYAIEYVCLSGASQRSYIPGWPSLSESPRLDHETAAAGWESGTDPHGCGDDLRLKQGFKYFVEPRALLLASWTRKILAANAAFTSSES
jgi:hypothetical protein